MKYKTKLDEVLKLQKKCQSAINHQKYRLVFFTALAKPRGQLISRGMTQLKIMARYIAIIAQIRRPAQIEINLNQLGPVFSN